MTRELRSTPHGSTPQDAGTVYSVREFSGEITALLESHFDTVSVRGEVSNLSRPQSGHLYFSLVDDEQEARSSRSTTAQLSVVAWRSKAARLRFRLEAGMKVIVTGRVSVYEPRGTYQLIADRIPEGMGELQLAFEQLRDKLEEEGIFDPARKRPLPFFPRRVGLITSPTGAAIRDFLGVVHGRCPGAWVRVIPVRVQGEGAAEEIARAIDRFQTPVPQVDVIVLARGGGSLEDLWAFNEEVVARALFRSKIPTVSAVGHEVDFTIADFAADYRAATPTAAGAHVVPETAELELGLETHRRRLTLALRSLLERRGATLDRLAGSRLFRDPQLLAQERFERVDRAGETLQNSLYNRWRQWNDTAFTLAARLEALSPLSVLARGYSVVTTADGRVVRRASELRQGDRVVMRLAEGRVSAVVETTENERTRPK